MLPLTKEELKKRKTLLYRYRQLNCSCKTENIQEDIADDVETRFDTLNFELDKLLPREK